MLTGITLYGSLGISEERTGDGGNLIELLSIGLRWRDKSGDTVESDIRGGLKGEQLDWNLGLISHLVKDHKGTYESAFRDEIEPANILNCFRLISSFAVDR